MNTEKMGNSLLERIYKERTAVEKIAPRTERDYLKKIDSIKRNIETKGEKFNATKLAIHIYKKIEQGEISQATARQLKASALYWVFCQTLLDVEIDSSDFNELDKAYCTIQNISTTKLPLKTSKTSSNKPKYFKGSAIDILEKEAGLYPNSQTAKRNLPFVKANILIGLRPSEWFGARFSSYLRTNSDGSFVRNKQNQIESQLSIIIDNAKSTHGRGNGESREILLNDITESELELLVNLQSIISEYATQHPHSIEREEIAAAFFDPLQKNLRHVYKKHGLPIKEIPTTYSTRHQAVANAKKSGLSDTEIAAMFGHISTATANKHYGKKRDGITGTKFRPSPESISEVKGYDQLFKIEPSQIVTSETLKMLLGASRASPKN